VSGGIDLSVGSQVALTTVVTANFLQGWGHSGANSVPWAPTVIGAGLGVLASMASASAVGIVTSRLRVSSFIASLGMMQIVRGIAKWRAHETTIVTPNNFLQDLMLVDPRPAWLIVAPGIWVALLLFVVVSVLMRRTVFGLHAYAMGSNEQAALRCGINIKVHRIWIFTVAGIFTGIAGVLQYGNLSVGDPTAASGMELDVIAAVVIGGGSLSGGQGTALGSLIGSLVMAVLRNGSNMLGVPTFVQEIIIGGIIIGAVALDRFRMRTPT
jgi:ribose transport system permease protein